MPCSAHGSSLTGRISASMCTNQYTILSWRNTWTSSRYIVVLRCMLLMLTSFGVQKYKLGDPTTTDVNLGPVCSVASAERIRKQVADAVKAGAKALIPEDLFPVALPYVLKSSKIILWTSDAHIIY